MTTWTERTAPSVINWVETITLKKESNNFYTGFTGIIGGKTPTKKVNNFYTLAGTTDDPANVYIIGKTISNFVETVAR